MAWGFQAEQTPHPDKKTKKNTDDHPTESYETIKLGIDAHAKWVSVAR